MSFSTAIIPFFPRLFASFGSGRHARSRSREEDALVRFYVELPTRWETDLCSGHGARDRFAHLFGQRDFPALREYFKILLSNNWSLSQSEERRMRVLVEIDRLVQKSIEPSGEDQSVIDWLEATSDFETGESLFHLLSTTDPILFEHGFEAVKRAI